MPGGRSSGSWSSTWDKPCHGYIAPCAAAHSAQMWCRASCRRLWASHSEPRCKYLLASMRAHQPRNAHSLTCSPLTAYAASGSPGADVPSAGTAASRARYKSMKSGAPPAAPLLDLRLGDHGEVELGAIRELGEDAPCPPVGGAGTVPQHVHELAKLG